VPVGEVKRIGRNVRKIQGIRKWRRGALDAGRWNPSFCAGMDPHGRASRLMIFCARETRGLTRPSFGLMARHGKSIAKQSEGRAGEKYLPVGGSRVRRLCAVEDQSDPIPEEITSELGGWGGTSQVPILLAEPPVGDCGRSTRAVKVTWLLPCGEGRRPIGVWISADGCSRLASNRFYRTGLIQRCETIGILCGTR